MNQKAREYELFPSPHPTPFMRPKYFASVDAIKHAKVNLNWFRSFGAPGVSENDSPPCASPLYNSVRSNVRHCDINSSGRITGNIRFRPASPFPVQISNKSDVDAMK